MAISTTLLNLTKDELGSRLNCFGEFDEQDTICLKACALSINCAIAKNKFLNFQLMEDSPFINHSDIFEDE